MNSLATALWHGFADYNTINNKGAFTISKAQGAYIYDDKGNKYFDATAGLWFANIGHGRKDVAEAVANQLSTVAHYSTFGDVAPEKTIELAEKLARISPVKDAKIFFTSGGSDSIDTALKIARRYWVTQGRESKKYVIGRSKAYHGVNIGGTSLAGIPGNFTGYGEFLTEAAFVPYDDADALEQKITELGADNVAAFFVEPIIGAGGVYLPPEGYLKSIKDICRKNNVLLVVDEVITGYGRIGGEWFASTKFDLEPDVITSAKGLTCGYVPMGAVYVAGYIAEPFFSGEHKFLHGYTYGGHAGAVAAALAVLDIVEKEELLAAAENISSWLHADFARIAQHPRVVEVRSGLGAVAAVEVEDPQYASELLFEYRRKGVSSRIAGGSSLVFSPPFISTREEISLLAEKLVESLDASSSGRQSN